MSSLLRKAPRFVAGLDGAPRRRPSRSLAARPSKSSPRNYQVQARGLLEGRERNYFLVETLSGHAQRESCAPSRSSKWQAGIAHQDRISGRAFRSPSSRRGRCSPASPAEAAFESRWSTWDLLYLGLNCSTGAGVHERPLCGSLSRYARHRRGGLPCRTRGFRTRQGQIYLETAVRLLPPRWSASARRGWLKPRWAVCCGTTAGATSPPWRPDGAQGPARRQVPEVRRSALSGRGCSRGWRRHAPALRRRRTHQRAGIEERFFRDLIKEGALRGRPAEIRPAPQGSSEAPTSSTCPPSRPTAMRLPT